MLQRPLEVVSVLADEQPQLRALRALRTEAVGRLRTEQLSLREPVEYRGPCRSLVCRPPGGVVTRTERVAGAAAAAAAKAAATPTG